MQTFFLKIAGLSIASLASFAAAQTSASGSATRPSLELELGAAQLKQNDLQSPNNATATRFDLASVIGTSSTVGTARITLRVPTASGSEWLGVYAPITFQGSAVLGQTVGFQSSTFAGAPVTNASYRFDTYRLTWRKPVYKNAQTILRLGVTGLLRDASIALSQPGVAASQSNTGFVPLLHASVERSLNQQWSLIGDLDALGSQQGRAIDLSLRAQYTIDRDWAVNAGYRVLDGGANNDTLYNFARVQWLTFGVRRTF
jgi:hypothetical protein